MCDEGAVCVMKVGEKAGCLLAVGLALAGVGTPISSSIAQAQHAMAGKPSVPKATTPTTGDWHPKSTAYIKASNANKDDQFGFAIALSGDGNTLVVSATGEDSAAKGVNAPPKGSALNSGAVYVYTRTAAGWKQQAYVKASNAAEGAQFGNALALSNDGNLLVIASTGEASSAKGINGDQSDASAEDSGAVYVYTRSGSTWHPAAYVKASNPKTAAEFGISVALNADGKVLAVGATRENSSAKGVNGNQIDTAAPNSGAAYVYY